MLGDSPATAFFFLLRLLIPVYCSNAPLCNCVPECSWCWCTYALVECLVCDCLRLDGQEVCRSIRDEVQQRVERVIHAHSLIFFLLPRLVNNELLSLRGKKQPVFLLLCSSLQRSWSCIKESRARIFSADWLLEMRKTSKLLEGAESVVGVL